MKFILILNFLINSIFLSSYANVSELNTALNDTIKAKDI